MTTNKQRKRGWRQFASGMALYAITVIVEGFLLTPETLSPVLGVVYALLPMVFAIWAMLGWLEALRSYDELQRKIYSEAGLLSLGLTAATTFTYGFLEVYVSFPKLSMFFVWPVIAASFGLGVLISTRRYR